MLLIILLVLSNIPDVACSVITVPSPAFPDLKSALMASSSSSSPAISHIRISPGVFYNFCAVSVPNSITNLTIIGSPDPHNATIIDCVSYSGVRALTMTSPNATISLSHLTFRNGAANLGGAVALIGPSLVFASICNCTFTGNTANGMSPPDGGGAVYILGANRSHVSIKHCNFVSNQVVTINTLGGGAVCIYFATSVMAASVHIEGGLYLQNAALFNENGGGGVAVVFNGEVWDSNVTVIDGNYTLNSASGSGGAVGLMAQNTSWNCNVLITGGLYSMNYAAVSGGAIAMVYAKAVNCSVTIAGTNSIGNGIMFSGSGGGAAFIQFSNDTIDSSITVVDALFYQNAAPGSSGGAGVQIFVGQTAQNCQFSIVNSTFISNIATFGGQGGGALVYVTNDAFNCRFTLAGGFFLGNSAEFNGAGGGGAQMHVGGTSYSSTYSVLNGNFTGNVANFEGGGGVLIRFKNDVLDSRVFIDGGTFVNNSAGTGGGAVDVKVEGNANNSSFDVFQGSYTSNVAEVGGGAIRIDIGNDARNSTATVRGTTCITNLAQGLFNNGIGGAVQISVGYSAHNFVAAILDGVYISNAGSFGGAAYMGAGGAAFNSVFLLSGGLYRQNIAPGSNRGVGGALQLTAYGLVQNTSISIRNSTFLNNAASYGGGALAVGFSSLVCESKIELEGLTFSQNMSPKAGGGAQIAFQDHAYNTTISIQRSTFSLNTATQGAGLSLEFWSMGSSLSVAVLGCSFLHNSIASLYSFGGGGGMSLLFFTGSYGPATPTATIYPSSISISDCSFAGNNASGLGGAALFMLPPGSPLTANCSKCTSILDPFLLWYPPKNPICKYPQETQYCSGGSMQNFYVPYHPQLVRILVTNVSFWQNSVNGMGGAVVVSNGFVRLCNVSFIGNSATQQAGGKYCTGTTEVLLSDSVAFKDNTAATQTTLLLNSQGSVTVEEGAVVVTESDAPPGFTVDHGQFDAATFLQTGEISVNGEYSVQCPAGFQYHFTPTQNVSVFVAEWPNAMMALTSSVSCVACGVNFYSMEGGKITIVGNNVSYTEGICHRCPYGADCSKGMNVVLATRDFWGYLSSDSKTWSFSRCPLGYCCVEGSGGCDPMSEDACAQGRNVSSPLCGSCLQGYSQNLIGDGCSKNEECNDAIWAWPALIGMACLWCLLLLWTSSYSAKKRLSSNSSTNHTDYSWIIPTLLFFFQNAYFLFMVQGGWPSTIVSIISAITNLHLHGNYKPSRAADTSWTKMCVMKDLSTLTSIGIQLVVPAVIFGLLMVYYGVIKLGLRNKKKLRHDGTGPAAMKTMMLSYSLIVSVCGALLHCVQIGNQGNGSVIRVIFRVGSEICGESTWQKGVWAVFGLVVLPFPVLLFGVQLLFRRKGISSDVIASIEEPYLANRWYWPSVVLLRRLSIALVYSLDDYPAYQGIWFCILFNFCLVTQLLVMPHKTMNGNVVEILSLIVLNIVSLCVLRIGSYFEANVMLGSVEQAAELTDSLDAVQTTLFFVPFAATILLIAGDKVKERFGVFSWTKYRWKKRSDGTEFSSYLLKPIDSLE